MAPIDAGRLLSAALRQMDPHAGHTSPAGSPATLPVENGVVKNAHSMGHGMSPFLFGDSRPFFVLFSQARVTNGGGLAAAVVGSALFALAATLFSSWSKRVEGAAAREKGRLSPLLLASTVTFALRLALHYLVMLLVMTMNVWVIVAVVVGHGVGYLLYEAAFQKRGEEAMESAKVVDAGCEC